MSTHHRIVIVGGGTAGIAVAARLANEGERDIALIEPSPKHYYQPLWTLVGGGRAKLGSTERDQSTLIPKGVHWIHESAAAFEPDNKVVVLGDGREVAYDVLVVCPGIQLDWNEVPGLADTLGHNGVSSNYSLDLAPKTWEMIRSMRTGTAVFMMPAGPIKCAGAPQKIAYLAADHWRKEGVLGDIEIVMALPTPGMFGVPEFAEVLEQVVNRYGIDVRFETVVSAVDPDSKEVTLSEINGDTSYRLGYDFLHAVPPQSAPDWVKASPLSIPGDAKGWIDIDKHTMQHVRYPDVFALGDAGSTPNSKTGAAIRKQAPVVAAERDRSTERQRDQPPLRRLRLLSDRDRPQQDAARRVRLHDAPTQDRAADRHPEGTVRHVPPQTVRTALHVLELPHER